MMKLVFYFGKYFLSGLIAVLTTVSGLAQSWTDVQLKTANTAADSKELRQVEKDIILYTNLARLYPKDFVLYELKGYDPDDRYAKSLIRTLNAAKPLPALTWNEGLQGTAACLVKEQNATGHTGHKRKECNSDFRAECISYGEFTGRDIVLQLLLDYDIPDLGHRKVCLSPTLSQVGVRAGHHPEYRCMAVLDFY